MDQCAIGDTISIERNGILYWSRLWSYLHSAACIHNALLELLEIIVLQAFKPLIISLVPVESSYFLD